MGRDVIAVLLFLRLALHGTASVIDCDFESPCGYIDDTSNERNWTIHSGRTPSKGTGPDSDHTTGHGHYAYMEASVGHYGETNRLLSPVFTPNDGQCLHFYYNMYGRTMGDLNVYIRSVNPNNTLKLWSKSGPQSSNRADWRVAVIRLPIEHGNVQIAFEAVRGRSYYSDIAIDDISLSDSCNFDNTTSNVTVSPVTPSPHTNTTSITNSTSSITSTPAPSTTIVTLTSGVRLTSNPGAVLTNLTRSLVVNCTLTPTSDVTSLVSLVVTKLSSDVTELAAITAFSHDQLKVSHDLGAKVTGHLDPSGQSYISFRWRYPGDVTLGRYRCEGFGLNDLGHPKVMAAEVEVTRLKVDCDKDVLPVLKDTNVKLDGLRDKLDAFLGQVFVAKAQLGNHVYQLSRPLPNDVQWAASLCDLNGGYLVEVNDRSELNFLVNFTQASSDDVIALGGLRTDLGQWEFLTSGGNMTTFNWADHATAWGQGQQCLFLNADRRMVAGACRDSSQVKLVCEMLV